MKIIVFNLIPPALLTGNLNGKRMKHIPYFVLHLLSLIIWTQELIGGEKEGSSYVEETFRQVHG